MIRTIYWENDTVILIDQKALPLTEQHAVCAEYGQVIDAINDLTIRGAPAIGIAAAMGIALGVLHITAASAQEFKEAFERICREFAQSRPTARNLFWAIERMKRCFETVPAPPPDELKDPKKRRLRRANEAEQISLFETPEQETEGPETVQTSWMQSIKKALVEEAIRMGEEDVAINRCIGSHGKILIRDGDNVLTHCNAGALATAGYGTALGIIRAAREEGKRIHVFVDETRPVLQGARLTAWEMMKENIPATLISDNMAGFLMKQGKVDKIVVGADRIAANGDTANKIGTYSLAVLAKAHGIPLYVAAPLSTIDPSIADGAGIPIEERKAEEVTQLGGVCTAPAGIAVYNPAFDVTPHGLITAIVTESGIIEAPFDEKIRALFAEP